MQDAPGMGGFFAIFALFAVFAIGTAIFKFSQTRQMALKKGATESEATAIALSGDVGTAASFVKHPEHPDAPDHEVDPADRPTADRIAEVRGLLDRGLISQDQADARITEILRSI